jgi:hypothetical protein
VVPDCAAGKHWPFLYNPAGNGKARWFPFMQRAKPGTLPFLTWNHNQHKIILHTALENRFCNICRCHKYQFFLITYILVSGSSHRTTANSTMSHSSPHIHTPHSHPLVPMPRLFRRLGEWISPQSQSRANILTTRYCEYQASRIHHRDNRYGSHRVIRAMGQLRNPGTTRCHFGKGHCSS